MAYFEIMFMKVIKNRMVRIMMAIQVAIILFSMAILDKISYAATGALKITEVMNYSFELNIVPLISMWIFVYIFQIMESSYDMQLMIYKGVSRVKVFSGNSAVFFSALILQSAILVASFFVGLEYLSGIKDVLDFSEVLQYLAIWYIGNSLAAMVIRLASLVVNKKYAVFILSTVLFAVQRYSISINRFDNILNPLAYSTTLFFQENRPSIYIMLMICLIILALVTFVDLKIFSNKDLSVYKIRES